MLPPFLGVSSQTWAAPRGGLFFCSDTRGAWFIMEGGLACTESADDRAFFSPVSTSALFGDVFPALSRRALGGRAERACRRRIVRHPAGPRPGGARSACSQHHVHGGAVSGPSDVGAGGPELGERASQQDQRRGQAMAEQAFCFVLGGILPLAGVLWLFC